MLGGTVQQEPCLCQHAVCEHVVSSWLALPEQAPGNANMTTTELSQAVESVAFMIRGEPRSVELRYLHGLLDMLTEWESAHPDEADAEPLVTAIHDLVSTLVLNAEPDS
jgi:hypothetical protein